MTLTNNGLVFGVVMGLAALSVPAIADEGGTPSDNGVRVGIEEGRGQGGEHGNGRVFELYEDDCQVVSGTFVSWLSFDGCTSPFGFCTEGELTGGLVGTYSFVMLEAAPISNDPDETTLVFTGTSTITTADGVIYGEDSGQMTFEGDFAFMTLVNAVGGEECFADTTGSLLATGNLDLWTGLTSGTWEAELCGASECLADGA
jgi:hypothetical protein